MTTEETRVSKRYSTEEISKVLKDWKESGKSQVTFSKEQGINYYTLNKWINDEKRKSRKAKPSGRGFVKLAIEEAAPVGLFAEIKKEGMSIILHQPVSSDFLRSLIR